MASLWGFLALLLLLLPPPLTSSSAMETLTITHPHLLHITAGADSAQPSAPSIYPQEHISVISVNPKPFIYETLLPPPQAAAGTKQPIKPTPFIHETLSDQASSLPLPAFNDDGANIPASQQQPAPTSTSRLDNDLRYSDGGKSKIALEGRGRHFAFMAQLVRGFGEMRSKTTQAEDHNGNVVLLDTVHQLEESNIQLPEDHDDKLENHPNAKAADVLHDEWSILKDNVHQGGDDAMLLLDDGRKHPEQYPYSPSLADNINTENNYNVLHGNVPQGDYSYLLSDGTGEDMISNKQAGPTTKLPAGHDQYKAYSPSNNNILQMGDRSRQHRRIGGGARSRTCTSNPDVCQELAEAEQIQFLTLYGQPTSRELLPSATKRRPACCAGTCVDMSTSPSHCGGCGKTCGVMQTCCDGKCRDLHVDPSNCGRCGHVCPTFTPCQFGMCGYY